MLFYKTIDTKTLELLKSIQKIELFKELRLVGGTSLALQIGHRISIDLDLFGEINADKNTITETLNKLGNLKIIHFSKNVSIYALNDVKIDIVNYSYPWIKESINVDNLKLANIQDIAAMKLAAITGRGSKKDFIDLFFLLKRYSLKELFAFYNQKFHDGSTFLVLKSLSYFLDADDELMPKMIINTDWETVKQFIKKSLNEFVME
jgi:predicted nucleotidyltransferase component of viral defense system